MSGMFGGGAKVKDSGAFQMTPEAKMAERQLLDQLMNQANGTGPSVANLQYEKAVGDAMKANKAVMASSRGVSNAGLLTRNVSNANADLMGDMAQGSAINKLQEQQGAQGMISNVVNGQRGVAAQTGIANQQASMQERQQNMNLIGNLGAGAAVAFSDEDLKKDKKKGNALRAVEEFLNSVEPYEYSYKGEDKKRLGVMAQDMEESEIGKQMVTDTPKGKVVDYGQGFSAMMAGLAEMNQRLKTIEKKKA